MRQGYRELIPIHQLATAEQIAATVAFLVGPGSGAVIGQVLQPKAGLPGPEPD